ncbi:unnamed protein product [Rhizophagus irregularis]|nr:unnamed protein product [Rhizophagus irregularis]
MKGMDSSFRTVISVETVSSFRTVISVGIISSFGIVIRYKGLNKPTQVNSSQVKYQFRLRFDSTRNSTHT